MCVCVRIYTYVGIIHTLGNKTNTQTALRLHLNGWRRQLKIPPGGCWQLSELYILRRLPLSRSHVWHPLKRNVLLHLGVSSPKSPLWLPCGNASRICAEERNFEGGGILRFVGAVVERMWIFIEWCECWNEKNDSKHKFLWSYSIYFYSYQFI